MRDYQLDLGIPKAQVYNQTMYILVAMLVIGLICNLLIRPLDPKWFMTEEELNSAKQLARHSGHTDEGNSISPEQTKTPVVALILAWTFIGVPLAWGIYKTYLSALKLF